jgi:hypothetical protein
MVLLAVHFKGRPPTPTPTCALAATSDTERRSAEAANYASRPPPRTQIAASGAGGKMRGGQAQLVTHRCALVCMKEQLIANWVRALPHSLCLALFVERN